MKKKVNGTLSKGAIFLANPVHFRRASSAWENEKSVAKS